MSAARKPAGPPWCGLALVVREVLIARHDTAYVCAKLVELQHLSPPEVLAWAVVELDPRNQIALAKALGFEDGTMPMLRRVFDKVRWASPQKKEVQPCSSQ